MDNINVSINGSYANIPQYLAGNAHEHKVKQLIFTTDWPEDAEGYAGGPLIKTIVFVTPAGIKLAPIEVTDNKIPLESSMLDGAGNLSFTLYGKIAGELAHNASGTLLVSAALSDLGGVDPAVYADITSNCVNATASANGIVETVQNKLDNGEFVGAAGANGTNGVDGAAGPNSVSTVTATTITGLIAGDGVHVSAPTSEQVGALPIPDAGGYFADDTINGALQQMGKKKSVITVATLSWTNQPAIDILNNCFVLTGLNTGNSGILVENYPIDFMDVGTLPTGFSAWGIQSYNVHIIDAANGKFQLMSLENTIGSVITLTNMGAGWMMRKAGVDSVSVAISKKKIKVNIIGLIGLSGVYSNNIYPHITFSPSGQAQMFVGFGNYSYADDAYIFPSVPYQQPSLRWWTSCFWDIDFSTKYGNYMNTYSLRKTTPNSAGFVQAYQSIIQGLSSSVAYNAMTIKIDLCVLKNGTIITVEEYE